jgi:hypothetical protein
MGSCRLRAAKDGLRLSAEAADEAKLRQVMEIMDIHVRPFAPAGWPGDAWSAIASTAPVGASRR